MSEFISNSGTLINPDSVYDQERFINILQIILQKKTQKELSEQTGLNNATISRMLNGARSGRPYKSTIDKIAKAIVQQVFRKRMKTVVVPRIDYKLICLLGNWLPARLKIWLVSKIY